MRPRSLTRCGVLRLCGNRQDAGEIALDIDLQGADASTIQAAGWDSETENELNEDDIERSIAEINAAIQRGGPLKKNEQN